MMTSFARLCFALDSTTRSSRAIPALLAGAALTALLSSPVRAQPTVADTQRVHAQAVADAKAPETATSPASPSVPNVPSAAAQDATDVREIVVTAQKRSERLLNVPISISVVNNALLASTNARNFSELQGVIPSVYFAGNSGGGRTYITMRGATGLALNTGDEPVAIYMDDVYLARGVTIGMTDLLDIGSIEIVRGPQGTLQGRNATAGAILIRSADPSSTFAGFVRAGISDPYEYRLQGAVSGPVARGLNFRLAAGHVYDRGWAYNPYTGKHIGGAKSDQVRAVGSFDQGGPFTARLALDYSVIHNQPAIFRYAATTFSAMPGALVKTPTPNTPLPDSVRDAIFDQNDISLNPGTFTRVRSYGLAGKVGYDFGPVQLISVTGAREAKVNGLNDSDGLDTTKMGFNYNNDNSKSISQEVRLQSSGSKFFNWIVGAYYFHEKQDYRDDIYNLSFTVPTDTFTRYQGVQTTRSYAVFADSTLNVTKQLQVIGGVRYTKDRKRLDASIEPHNLTTGIVTHTIYAPPADSWSDVSWRAKLVWHPIPGMMLFGGFGKGFRAGGYNPFAVQVPYAPEKNKSFEVGAKGQAFGNLLTYSLAAYWNDYTNLQLRAGVPTGGAIITNAANSRIKGVEAELTARPAPDIRLTGNMAYTNAYFTSFPTARDTLDHPVDATGNKLPRSPKWQFYVSGEKDFALSPTLLITAEANYRWRDKIYFYFTNQSDEPWFDGPGGELGARVTLHPRDNRYSLSLFGTNLTNARIINTAAITFSYPQVGLNKPRVFGISGEFRF